ncbi:uncharacterized protein LOC109838733 [Asparagus officinalis]|uniref:uncharacterized protein LOC109821709 n=1 Tax=Asparagus officinalis TaxID=4686 RepID=UPI00098DF7D6|nr:uncharacterized protein LOC109821709 [Asparagus officinalis]XP_020262745.1 uncharacterized protein LOC109838733 [Asparagus officinalis]
MGLHPNFPMPYMMPQNFGMQYPYNHPYMPYGYPPVTGNSYVPGHMNDPSTDPTIDPNTPRFSSGSTDIPEFSTQISLETAGGDTPHSFLPPTQQSAKRTSYDTWSTEENKILLTAYFHVSNDSELGINQKGDTFWGKITDYVNERTQSGKQRTSGRCSAHFRHLNKKISSFVGCYRAACKERRSGWSDENYISKAVELYQENENARFTLLDEWKLVRHQPKYMTGANESGSSGSKRKSSGEDVESPFPSLVRPEGRDASKKKSKASSSKASTSRKAKFSIEEELSKLTSKNDNIEQNMANTVSAMLEFAAGQKEVARIEKMKMWMILKNKEDRDDEDEYAYRMLKKELFEEKFA